MLRTFDIDCQGQTSLEAVFVMFSLGSMKFRKLKGLHQEDKKLSLHKV